MANYSMYHTPEARRWLHDGITKICEKVGCYPTEFTSMIGRGKKYYYSLVDASQAEGGINATTLNRVEKLLGMDFLKWKDDPCNAIAVKNVKKALEKFRSNGASLPETKRKSTSNESNDQINFNAIAEPFCDGQMVSCEGQVGTVRYCAYIPSSGKWVVSFETKSGESFTSLAEYVKPYSPCVYCITIRDGYVSLAKWTGDQKLEEMERVWSGSSDEFDKLADSPVCESLFEKFETACETSKIEK